MSEYINPSTLALTFDSVEGPTNITFAQLDYYVHEQLILSSVFGVRIGLATICLPVTYLITKNKKSPIFTLNMLCLFILFIHSIMYMFLIHDPYSTLAEHFSGYTKFDQVASAVSAATNTIYFLLVTLVECSLTYQVYIIFKVPGSRIRLLRYILTAVSALAGLTTIGIYFAYMVMTNKVDFFEIDEVPKWLVNTPIFCFTGTSCLTSVLLLLKLAVAIRARRRLGLKQFSIFHILFIMAFQTLIVPTVIIILSFHGVKSPYALSAIGMALITLSLPITTMWANSVLDGHTPSSSGNTYLSYMHNLTKRNFNSPGSSPTLRTVTEQKDISTDLPVETPTTLHDSGLTDDQKIWHEVEMYTDVLNAGDLDAEKDRCDSINTSKKANLK